MNPHNLIVPIMHDAVERVMAAMLGIAIGAGKASIEWGVPEPGDGVGAFIGIAGTWAGTGSMSCSAKLACRFCGLMLMTEAPSMNEDVLDAVGELTNMIVGNVKTDLERHLGPLCLSSPTAIIGRSFKTKGARNTQWNVLQYDIDGEPLTLKLSLVPRDTGCLAPDRSPGARRVSEAKQAAEIGRRNREEQGLEACPQHDLNSLQAPFQPSADSQEAARQRQLERGRRSGADF